MSRVPQAREAASSPRSARASVARTRRARSLGGGGRPMSPWYMPPPWTSATPWPSLLEGVAGALAERDIAGAVLIFSALTHTSLSL